MNSKFFEKRFNVMTVIILLTFLVLIIRMGFLQLVKGEELNKRSEGNRIQIVPITAPRGEFRDRMGRIMVSNRPGFTVSYLRAEKSQSEEEKVFNQLRDILDIPHYTLKENEPYIVDEHREIRLKQRPVGDLNGDNKIDVNDVVITTSDGKNVIKPVSLNPETGKVVLDINPGTNISVSYTYDTIKNKIIKQGYKKYIPVRLKTDVSLKTVSEIEERGLPGVVIEVEPIRRYLYGEVAAHVFGYLGEINQEELNEKKDEGYRLGDFIGKTGLEKVLEPYLKGKNGGRQVEVTAKGDYIRTLGRKNAIPGDTVYLTIDAELQKTAESALKKMMNKLQNDPYKPFPNANRGAVVVINVKTGEILAMVSEPGFDPNLFASGISSDEWKFLVNDPLQPLFNKAISGLYPPGSIFKMVVAVAALEEKVTTPEEVINTNGGVYWTIAPKKCWYWNKGGHGLVNMVSALAKSCNIYFYEMGRRLGIDNIEKYARQFGLGEKTGIELPRERQGIVASREYKEKYFSRPQDKIWYPAETLDAAIGQGFHSYTPIEIANYIATLANGGTRYKPHLIKKIVSPDGEVVLEKKPEVVGKLSVSPETLEVVKKGMRAVVEPGGTAWYAFKDFPIKVAGKTGTAQWDTRYENHGWFASFAPYEDPEIAVVVLIEQSGSGGSTGGPVAKAIYEKYFGLKDSINEEDVLIQP
ncbi:MAG: penicillin-binding protein 2 [Thermosediminibacterales bacterium]|nr:penicillin-binding protein 2 [Thermosediminibacterales bacterium]MDK2835529.1 penicillin-binding protein 2 [Thermosediminibacterales bacterium]